MRASIRGSMRKVMVTDSAASALPAVADSIRRRSGRFSAQKTASASSLSKRGTSSQLANERIVQMDVWIIGCLDYWERLQPATHQSTNPLIHQSSRLSPGKSLSHFPL